MRGGFQRNTQCDADVAIGDEGQAYTNVTVRVSDVVYKEGHGELPDNLPVDQAEVQATLEDDLENQVSEFSYDLYVGLNGDEYAPGSVRVALKRVLFAGLDSDAGRSGSLAIAVLEEAKAIEVK